MLGLQLIHVSKWISGVDEDDTMFDPFDVDPRIFVYCVDNFGCEYINASNRLVSQMRASPEHKTQYFLIRAPYTRIVVCGHISNKPPVNL